jgi:flagellar capping protein FliD
MQKKRITLALVMQHLQHMNQTMIGEFKGVRGSIAALDRKIDSVDQKLTRRIDSLHRKFDTQISNMDERLDDLEIVQIPRLKKAVGIR